MPTFDLALADNGYGWWYLDASSDDGQHHLVIILMLGNVFSPYYRRARQKGDVDPLNHCAVNAILYNPGGKRWAMTERDRRSLARDADLLRIGPSSARMVDDQLIIELSEITVPLPSRLSGQVRVTLPTLSQFRVDLDQTGRHWWQPLAPRCAVSVEMKQPALRWQGSGYLDHNAGTAPLEDDFVDWSWSRSQRRDGTTTIHYHRRLKSGGAPGMTVHCLPTGEVESRQPADEVKLPNTRIWRMHRSLALESGSSIREITTLEDTPFYARSLVQLNTGQGAATAIHETVSLKRFCYPVVQAMLPFRMPRNGWLR